jgi:peptide/nickel transport system permease protein
LSTTLPVGTAPLPEVLPPIRNRGHIRTFIRRHPTIVVGGTLLGVMVFIAIFAPWLGTTDPTAIAPAKRIRDPSALYWFGTDMLGRDIYSRVMYGARISLGVGFAVALIA